MPTLININCSNIDNPCSGSPSTMRNSEVRTVLLYGVPIIALVMDGSERLCLAQISNTLLKNFSYNEIHNRRVALGITCIQCTPVQLELLRRAGAMPVSSRRCGMITKREAERLCKSFLSEMRPPKLPDNFAFDVYHHCAWGCKGNFIPSRYNSSRAKCIKCCFCGLFFSPNKFIFHSHRLPESKYVQPDAANFNSWRRHIKLNGSPSEEISIVWEDVKAMFNGGSRKRAMSSSLSSTISSSTSSSSSSVSQKTIEDKTFHHEDCEDSSSPNLTSSSTSSSNASTKHHHVPTTPCLTLPCPSSKTLHNLSPFSATSLINGSKPFTIPCHHSSDLRTNLSDFMWNPKQPSTWTIPYSCVLWPRPPVASRLTSSSSSSSSSSVIANSEHVNPLFTPFNLDAKRDSSLSSIDNDQITSTYGNASGNGHLSAFKPVLKLRSTNDKQINNMLNNVSDNKDIIDTSSLPSNDDADDADIDVIGNHYNNNDSNNSNANNGNNGKILSSKSKEDNDTQSSTSPSWKVMDTDRSGFSQLAKNEKSATLENLNAVNAISTNCSALDLTNINTIKAEDKIKENDNRLRIERELELMHNIMMRSNGKSLDDIRSQEDFEKRLQFVNKSSFPMFTSSLASYFTSLT